MTFEFQGLVVMRCADCSRNQSYQNPLLGLLPPTHYCADTFDLHTKGRLILNPNTIPKWCPHVKPD
jgi:hypothetical protein